MTTTTTKTLSQLLTECGSRWAPMARGENTWTDLHNDAIKDLIERYEDDPEALLNYETSDWVNLDECYTADLLKRWDHQTDSIKALFNDYCEAIDASSTLQALESECDSLEDGDDMNTAIVNKAMTWAALELIRELYPNRS
mgnify:CR=1 FL=1